MKTTHGNSWVTCSDGNGGPKDLYSLNLDGRMRVNARLVAKEYGISHEEARAAMAGMYEGQKVFLKTKDTVSMLGMNAKEFTRGGDYFLSESAVYDLI